jgi:signal transduction histidine kinase
MESVELTHLGSLSQAIEHLRAHRVDVLLLDLTLPESSGLQTVYRILEHAADVPVVVLTGANDGELAINAVKAGVQDYLIKGDTDSEWLLRCMRYAIERKRGEQALAKKNEQLEESNQNLRQLAFAMTHDLQTPLASLTGAVDVLRSNISGGERTDSAVVSNDASSECERWLDRVDSAAARMTDMLDNLLEYAKAGAVTVECQPVSLRDVVERVVQETSSMAAGRGIAINIQFDDVTVSADAPSLHRILANLLGNAVKFSPHGAAIDITTVPCDPAVQLRIADHGPGIPPDKIEYLYLPFKRLNHQQPGTGLGLSIARRLAEAIGGRAWLESDGRSGVAACVELQRHAAGDRE